MKMNFNETKNEPTTRLEIFHAVLYCLSNASPI